MVLDMKNIDKMKIETAGIRFFGQIPILVKIFSVVENNFSKRRQVVFILMEC
jgi:hypothetical protein